PDLQPQHGFPSAYLVTQPPQPPVGGRDQADTGRRRLGACRGALSVWRCVFALRSESRSPPKPYPPVVRAPAIVPTGSLVPTVFRRIALDGPRPHGAQIIPIFIGFRDFHGRTWTALDERSGAPGRS